MTSALHVKNLFVTLEKHVPLTGTVEEIMQQSHNELLTAGDALLNNLSVSARERLSEPVSAEVWEEMCYKLSEGNSPNDLTVERARAAFAVAEASLTFESLVLSRLHTSWENNTVVIYEQEDLIRLYNRKNPLGHQIVPYSYLIGRISKETGVRDFVVSKELLCGIILLLREGKVRIPGLRAEELKEYGE